MIGDAGLRLLGLGARAGAVVLGTGAVRGALQRGRVYAVVLASDSSRRTEDKVVRLARAKGVSVLHGPPAAALGKRLGRDSLQAVGILEPQLANGLIAKARSSSVGG